jgi:hypothetical protein
MDLAPVLTFMRDHAAALRTQSTGYSWTSQIRAGLTAQADALEAYAAAVEAAGPSELPYGAPSSVLLLLV